MKLPKKKVWFPESCDTTWAHSLPHQRSLQMQEVGEEKTLPLFYIFVPLWILSEKGKIETQEPARPLRPLNLSWTKHYPCITGQQFHPGREVDSET